MDRKTRRRIEQMDEAELGGYRRTVRAELDLAEAKRSRLRSDISRTSQSDALVSKRAKLRRLDKQIAALREILHHRNR